MSGRTCHELGVCKGGTPSCPDCEPAAAPAISPELIRANELLLATGERLRTMSTCAHQLGELLADILALHIAGDAAALTRCLNQIQASHIVVLGRSTQGLH